MPEFVAIKRLARSDLSFFEWHFRANDRHRQKGINLNKDVFEDEFYPLARQLLGTLWPVFLTIRGPGIVPAFSPAGDHRRPITYNNGKNWRLNGGTVDDSTLPDRFRELARHDLAVLVFRGIPAPTEIDVTLVARALPSDADLYARLDPMVGRGRNSMASVTVSQIADALGVGPVPMDHPLSSFLDAGHDKAAVEEVAHGGPAPAILSRRRGGRKLTQGELSEARAEASRVGADGELLLNTWLAARQQRGEIRALEWLWPQDAIAPFDFRYQTPDGAVVKLDAKSTEGPFDRTIHISLAELLEAAADEHRYGIARLYSMNQQGARVRIAEDIRVFARQTLAELRLPDGVRVDSFAVHPRLLQWGEEFMIERPAEEDED